MSQPLLCAAAMRIAQQIHIDDSWRQATLAGTPYSADTTGQLLALLSHAVYQRFHQCGNGEAHPDSNNLIDRAFAGQLTRVVPHRYTLHDVHRLPLPIGIGPVVELDGLRVRVDESDLVRREGSLRLRLPAVRPAVSPGYLLVAGSAGGVEAARHVLRVYLHVPGPDAALVVWQRTLGALEDAGVRYVAKVLCAPERYPRQDAVVVYLSVASVGVVRQLVEEFLGGDLVGSTTSAFARTLAPGVSYGWEPTDRRVGYRGLSFGEHRARVIVDGVAAAMTQHAARDQEPGRLASALAAAFERADIDPQQVHRNRDSPELSDQ